MGQRPFLEKICDRLGIHHPTFAVCICQFGTALLHTCFMFYYVKIFLNRYHVKDYWFDIAQVLFLIWNAVNDPIFGYMQNASSGWLRHRRKVILYGSVFFSLSFLVPWYPWTSDGTPEWLVGLHLIVSLYLYDGMFSFVVLAWSALFAEITTDHVNRVRAMKYNQVAVLCGVNVLFVLDKVSNSATDFGAFQSACVVVSIVAFFCFWYSGRYSPDKIAQCDSFSHLKNADDTDSSGKSHEFYSSSWRITKQILLCPDFLRFTWMNFWHTFRSTAHLNFAAIITERLIPASILPVGSWRISCFYGLGAVIPQLLVICGSCFVVRHGSYRLMIISFYLSVISGVIMLLMGSEHSYAIMVFMLVDSVAVHTFAPLTNIFCAELVDQDMILHRRGSPVSSVIFGLNALITKPAISLAPMSVVYILDKFKYETYKKDQTLMSQAELEILGSAMFYLLCLTAVIPAALQWLVFRDYTLRDKHVITCALPRDLAAMSTPVLHYFNGRGKAECIRMLLTVAGIEFTEVDYTEREQFLKVIPELLFQQVPMLEIDGKNIVQSGAILRYIAHKHGLAGKTEDDRLQVDVLMEGTRDFYRFFLVIGFEDEKAALDAAHSRGLPRYMPIFEKILCSNDTGYLVGNSLTLADVGLMEVLLSVKERFAEGFDGYPKLKEYVERLSETPQFAKFLNGPHRKGINTPEYISVVRRVLKF